MKEEILAMVDVTGLNMQAYSSSYKNVSSETVLKMKEHLFLASEGKVTKDVLRDSMIEVRI